MKVPNCLSALLAAINDTPATPGSVEVVEVQHDPDCGIFRQRE